MAQQPNPARERVRRIVPKMIELSEQVIYGDIWERPGLSKRDRSLIVVATLIATYRPEQLKGHLGRALVSPSLVMLLEEPQVHTPSWCTATPAFPVRPRRWADPCPGSPRYSRQIFEEALRIRPQAWPNLRILRRRSVGPARRVGCRCGRDLPNVAR